jgi:hypothetical protein
MIQQLAQVESSVHQGLASDENGIHVEENE